VEGDPIDGTGTPADPRVARTRAAVLNAGIDLLAERGYPGFTIDAIVARTGIAKTTIYRHWPSRDSLLTAVISHLDGGGALPDTGSVRQDLTIFLTGRVQMAHTRQWQRCMPALVEAAALDPGLARIISTLTARYLSQMQALLRRGRDRGEIRHDISLELAASALMGTFAFRRLLLQKNPTTPQVTAVLDILLDGISPPARQPPPASPPPSP
jgi:AcrR family transcriptional regulator